MKITNKVKIGGRIFNVVYAERPDKGDLDVDGQIVCDTSEITLRESKVQSKDYVEMVFLHEIMHGIYNLMGIEQNEENITAIAKGLHTVIIDNPEIFREVTNEKESKPTESTTGRNATITNQKESYTKSNS